VERDGGDLYARYVRQILLPEIGEAGQRAILAATARVSGDGLACDVAERYARAAGFGAIASGSPDLDALAPPTLVTSPPAREVLAGARAALAALREAIGVAPTDRGAALPPGGSAR
jgi:hypothetical protein